LSDLLDGHAPIKEHTTTLRPHAPWFSDELRALKRDKWRCERRWVKSGLEVHKQLYRDSACNYYAAIKEAKRAHFSNKISNSNQKQLFNLIDSLFKVKGSLTLPTHDSELVLANRFCAFFTDKISALRSELDTMPSRSLSIPYQEQPSSSTLSKFKAVSLQDVKQSVMAAPSKSCSLDPLPTSLLKKGIHVLLPCITSIINRSLEVGEFPATFKHGLVTPLLKKSDLDHEILKNYHPISNLPFLGKMIERVVAMQFKHRLLINNLYTKTQSAYRAYHSTKTALL